MAILTKIYEGTYDESLRFEGNHLIVEVLPKDWEGDVQVETRIGGELEILYLNQDQIKELINHLQKQLIS